MKRLLLMLMVCGSAAAVEPAWWTDTTSGTDIIDGNATPNNSGPLNQAQLKNVAKKAALYLDNELPAPGAGAAVNTMVGAFPNDPVTALEPVNLGQLKAVAKPFYDRLMEVGFDTKQSLQNHGEPGWLYDYPWNGGTPKSVNLAPASIGQLKWVFSFDLTTTPFVIIDTDGDLLPDAWEIIHELNPNSAADGDIDSDGDGLSNAQEYFFDLDPNSNDTDGDSLLDGEDPDPLIQNPKLGGSIYVDVPTYENNNSNRDAADFTSIKLKWTPASYEPTGYILEEQIDDGPVTQVSQVASSTTEVPITGLLANQTYTYLLTAYKQLADGRKIYSSTTYVSYGVPLNPRIVYQTAYGSTLKSSDSIKQFGPNVVAPKYYKHWLSTGTMSPPNSVTQTSTIEATFDPSIHELTWDQIGDDQGGNQGSALHNHTHIYGTTANWVKGQLAKTSEYHTSYTQDSSSPGWSDHFEYSSDITQTLTYTLNEANSSQSALWIGGEYDPTLGYISWSTMAGSHSEQSQNGVESYNHTYAASQNSDGSWSGDFEQVPT